jgi:DNA-binding NarL/FixJ family response regulator
MRRRYTFGTILVGKSSLLKEGLAGILRSANFRILTSVSCADDLPTSKAPPSHQLCIIVHTGDDFDAAVEQIELFRTRHPDGRIAIVADRYRLDELVSAFRAGANGYFVDVMTSDVLIKSLELVMMGGMVFPACLSFVLDTDGNHLYEAASRDDNNQGILVSAEGRIAPQLSAREKSILRCLIEGDSNKSIARKIDIAETTVKVHVKAILRKIRVHNRTQAAIWGMNNGSLARTTNTDSPPLVPGLSKRLPTTVETDSEVKQTKGSMPAGLIQREANRIPRHDHLVGKGVAPFRK